MLVIAGREGEIGRNSRATSHSRRRLEATERWLNNCWTPLTTLK
jgi:hypothetical protein